MNWFRDNWQIKLMAFSLALFLWLVLYLNPPVSDFRPTAWPPPPHNVDGR
jgi:hypothetical protein